MKTSLSPKELAQAVGASESSLKRWVDSGVVEAVRTAGGHRRIPIAEAVRFIREHRMQVLNPAALGISELASVAADQSAGAEEPLYEALLAGRAPEARGLILGAYLGGIPIAEICDGPVRASMHRLGELWKHDRAGVFLEHRATEICIQAMTQLRLMLEPPEGAPVAVGGAPAGDPYLLPSMMAATVLLAEGYRAVNLGPDTPVDTLLAAIAEHDPLLVWLSVSTRTVMESLEPALGRIAEAIGARHGRLVVGGRVRAELIRRVPPGVETLSSMAELAAFARGLALSASGA